MVFLTSLQSIVPIVLLISLGYILKGRGMFNPSFSGNLSRFIMSVILPAGPVIAVLPIVANESGADVPFATGLVTISTVLFVIVIPIIMEILTMIGIVI